MNKSTLLAVVVFAALAVVVVLSTGERRERGITRISFAEVSPDEITRLTVEGPKPIELRKTDDGWKVGDKEADASAVERALEAIPRIESSELVSEDPNRFDDYEVGEEKGARVRAERDGTVLAEAVIGSGSRGGSNVRVGDTVYAVKGVYRTTFQRDRAQWLERKLFADEVDDIARVEVRLQDAPAYAIVREDDTWRLEDERALPEGFRFDAEAAARLVSTLVTARASDIPEEPPAADAAGLGDAADVLAYSTAGEDGDAKHLRIGAEAENGGVYARTSTRDDVVTLPAYLASNLRKSLDDLRDLSLMDVDVSTATRLELQSGEDRLVFEKTDGDWTIAESSVEVAEDFELDPGLVRQRLNAIANVRASGVAEETASADVGLASPEAFAAITREDGESVRLAFGAPAGGEEGAVYAQGNVDDLVYRVKSPTRDRLLAMLPSFEKREVPAGGVPQIDPQALQNLPPEVRESLMRQMAEQRQKQRLMEQLQQRSE